MFVEVLYFLIGWVYLWFRYRNKKKIKEVLKNNYDNQYNIAGAQIAMSVVGVLFFGLLAIFLLAVIGRILYDLVT